MSVVHALGFATEVIFDVSIFVLRKTYEWRKWAIWGTPAPPENLHSANQRNIDEKMLELIQRQEDIIVRQTAILETLTHTGGASARGSSHSNEEIPPPTEKIPHYENVLIEACEKASEELIADIPHIIEQKIEHML